MNVGLEHVRAIIGSHQASGLDDNTIKNALWNEYFDVDRAVDWLMGQWIFLLHRSTVLHVHCRGRREETDCYGTQR